MKQVIFFLFILLISTFSLAQKVDVKDTIKAAAFQNFDVPPFVLTNIMRIDYTVDLLDASLQKIRECKNLTQKPKKEDFAKATSGGRGTTFILFIKESIEQTGSFYIRLSVKASGELGSLTKEFFYLVNVDNPTIASAVNLRPKYFYGEQGTFSFATVEFGDINAYSFKIEDGGRTVLTGVGPIVSLDTVLNNIEFVGKQLAITGMYNGKEFTFKNAKNEILKSSWQITIDKPSLTEFAGWKTVNKDDKGEEFYISIDNPKDREFLFTYIGNTPTGFVVVKPKFKNYRVTSDFEGLVNGLTNYDAGSFSYLVLQINEDVYSAIPVGQSQDIKISLTFSTQFENNVKKEFRATIIR
ncbi:MAG: hypothetical protein M0Q21_09695 [Ignavibacteriaceae bacterium]|nr:hypothetical protein [Ignavibacteriaceae bacterium]